MERYCLNCKRYISEKIPCQELCELYDKKNQSYRLPSEINSRYADNLLEHNCNNWLSMNKQYKYSDLNG